MLVTTEDCVSEFGGWLVIDEGLDCTMTADVTVTNTDENESNGALVVTVEGAEDLGLRRGTTRTVSLWELAMASTDWMQAPSACS